MSNKIKNIHVKTEKLKEIIFDPTVRILPGQIAFFLILSIFPLLMLIGYIGSFFDISISSLVNFVDDALPKEVANVIADVISGKSFDSTVGISMITAFIMASNGAHAITLASNALYGFPPDDFLKRRIKALLLIVILVLLFMFFIIFLAYGNLIAKTILDFFNLSGFAKSLFSVFAIVKWPIAMIIVYVSVKLIYTIAPDWHILSKNTTKGALFTTFGWTISTAIFSYYISHFANYDIFYGSLSNIIIMMIWVYVLSYILVVGIAINVKHYRDNEENKDLVS